MYRRTLNNKSSISDIHYSLQQNDLINNLNQLNFNDPIVQNRNTYNDAVYLRTRYDNDDKNNYIQYIYPYGNLNNHNIFENINTPVYNPYQIDSYNNNNNNNNIQDLNIKYYYNHRKSCYNQRHNKWKNKNEVNQNTQFNNLKRWNSLTSFDPSFNIKYLDSKKRYFHGPIDIQVMKEQNNNKPFIAVPTTSPHYNKNNNHNHSKHYSNFKYKKNSNQRYNLQNNDTLNFKEQVLALPKNKNQDKLDQLYNLISKPHNNKRKTNQPLFYIAGLQSLPIFSFNELITYEEVANLINSFDSETKQLADYDNNNNNGSTFIQPGLKQYFKKFRRNNNTQQVDTVIHTLETTDNATPDVLISISSTTSNDHNNETDDNNGNSTQIIEDEDDSSNNNNIKRPIRNLIQTKTSTLSLNKQLQQYPNDSFELSFDGKAMDRSDIFRMVDSFSVIFDNDRDPNTSNSNINNSNGSNSNSQPFDLSENILPEEITNNIVY